MRVTSFPYVPCRWPSLAERAQEDAERHMRRASLALMTGNLKVAVDRFAKARRANERARFWRRRPFRE